MSDQRDEQLLALRCAPRLFALSAGLTAGAVTSESGDTPVVTAELRAVIAASPRHPDRAPEVSVVIPTFDRPDLVLTAADSARHQPAVDLEIVVVNDSPCPLGEPVLQALAMSPTAVTVLEHGRQRGAAAARNTGARVARGAWIMMLDDDDTLVDGSVRSLLDVAVAHGASFVYGDHFRQRYNGDVPGEVEYRCVGPSALEGLPFENPIMCGSFLMERRLFQVLRGYREDLLVHEDYNLHLRALHAGRPFYASVPVCTYHLRTALRRQNDRRLHWFATAAFNHALYRALFGRSRDRVLKIMQREYQYAHLKRSMDEGCPLEFARTLVARWWDALAGYDLSDDLAIDRDVIARLCPAARP